MQNQAPPSNPAANPQSNPQTNRWLRKAQFLTQALIISGTLNIGLVATFVYFALRDKETSITLDHKPAKELSPSELSAKLSNEQLLRAYCTLPFQELVLRLENKDLIEDGYTKRDLALASLVAFHHFNLERALGGLTLQRRHIAFSSQDGEEKGALTVFPGLADFQYQAIIQYAKTEKWPYTSEGLFFELKGSTFPRDPSLLSAFYLTPEYHTLFTLFLKSGVNINKEVLVEMLIEGEWKTLSTFTEQQRLSFDLTEGKRQGLLIDYLHAHSRMAAKILLETEREFSLKRLGDVQVLLLLDLVQGSTALEGFAKELLTSARSDLVWKKAALVLYSLAKEVPSEPYDHQLALARFVPQLAQPAPKTQVAVQPASKEVNKEKNLTIASKTTPPKNSKSDAKSTSKGARVHVVQEGDSLWKIAKKYQVSVDAIKKLNHLESEKLRVGTKLDIPKA